MRSYADFIFSTTIKMERQYEQSILSWDLGEEVLSDNVKFRALTCNGEPITIMLEDAIAPFESNKFSQLDLRLSESMEKRLIFMQTRIANTYGAKDTFKPFLNLNY